MAKECKKYIDVVSTQNFHKEQEDTIGGLTLTDETANAPWMIKLMARLGARGPDYKLNDPMLKKAIKDEFGTLDETKYLATRLLSLIEANPGLEEIIGDHMLMEGSRLGDRVTLRWKNDGANRAPDFSSFPKPVLKGAINEMHRIIRHGTGENIGKGLLGKVLYDLTTPKAMAKKEYTGALYNMRKTVRDFVANQANRASRFLKADFTKTDYVTLVNQKTGKFQIPKLRNYGMVDILKNISNLSDNESLARTKNTSKMNKIYLVDMFIRFLTKDDLGNRRLNIAEDGKMFVATEYNQAIEYDEDGKIVKLKYKSTGDPIYELSNYVPAEEYYGDNNIVFTKDMFKVLYTEADRYRELHKNVNDYMNEEAAVEKQKMYSAIRSLFPNKGWDDKDITQLFFLEDPSLHHRWSELEKEDQNLIRYIHKNSTKYNVMEPFFSNSRVMEDPDGQKIDIGRDSFPVTYGQMKFSQQWDEMIFKYEAIVKEITTDLNNPGISLELERELVLRGKKIKKLLDRAKTIRDRKDDYPVDFNTGTYLPLGADSKHIKHISNAFNILDGRTDIGAYDAYLKHGMNALERMSLSTTYILNLKRAKSQPVKNYITNLFKVATYQPDAASGFLWLKYDSDTVSKTLGKANIKITPAQIDRKMKQLLSFTSGNMLRGFSTAALNQTAVIQKFIDVGMDRVLEAVQIMKESGPELERIIERTGVIDFREYFSSKLASDATNLGAENKHVMEMTVAMLEYWKEIDRIPKNATKGFIKKKERELKEAIEQKMGRAIQGFPSKKRLSKRLKVQKDQHRLNLLSHYVDYAVNKRYEASPYIKNWIVKKGASLVEGYTAWVPSRLTMGGGESWLRTLSVVIGIRSAMRQGFINNKSITDLTEDEIDAVIEIGRNYTESHDFGLSRQDIGPVGQSDIGAFFTKFKVWPFQKMSKDLETIRLAYQELKDIDIKGFDYASGAKMMASLVPFSKNQTALRSTSPALAAFRTWIFTQGLWTAIWDFAIMGPLLVIPGMKKLSRTIPGMRTVGGATSDLVSLILLVPGLAVALANGDGDDNVDKILDYYSRKTIFGFGATWTFNWFLAFLAFSQGEDEKDFARRISSQIAPLAPPVVKEVIVAPSTVSKVLEAIDY